MDHLLSIDSSHRNQDHAAIVTIKSTTPVLLVQMMSSALVASLCRTCAPRHRNRHTDRARARQSP